MLKRARPLPLLALGFFYACGGDGGGGERPPPSMTTRTTAVFSFQSSDLCAAKVPKPTDLFRDDEGSAEATCASASDPVETAIQRALADEGAPLDATLKVPLDPANGVDAVSITASVAFSLTSSVATSSTAIPPILLLQRTGLSTSAAGWRVLNQSATFASAESELHVVPARPLENGGYYVLVVTDAAMDTKGKSILPSAGAAALTGVTNVVAGAFEGLDADGAAKMERERKRLQDIVGHLERAHPRVPRNKIVSIQGFGAALGFTRMTRAIAAYQSALQRGRFTFQVTSAGGDLDPDTIFPAGTPMNVYRRIAGFRRGTIRVPKVLDATGKVRRGWATSAIEYSEMPFLLSIPDGVQRYPVVIALPGWGRSKLDAREMSKSEVINGTGGAAAAGLAVLGLDLAGHGDRTIDPATGMIDTTDTASNNDNTEFQGADGIPDKSGAGWLRGEPQALRDGLIAATIEVLHVIETIKDGDAFTAIAVSPNAMQIHLVAHGHSAPLAVYLGAFSTSLRTIQVPAGGAGVRELIAGGPMRVKEAFLAGSPIAGNAAQLDGYLGRLESTVLEGVSLQRAAAITAGRFVRNNPSPRILLAHGQLPSFVSAEARMKLVQLLELPPARVSRHLPFCDDFFLHTCRSGETPLQGETARNQLATFASSGGVTVLSPAAQ